MLNVIRVKQEHLKAPRLRLEITFKDGHKVEYEQFYFDKQNITNDIKYVWYL